MTMILLIAGILTAYFLGSIPTAVWISKRFYNIDVRTLGSGNSGSTNTFRTLGVKAGLVVQLVDISKGFIAAYLAARLQAEFSLFEANKTLVLQVVFGLAAVLGHIFPIFAQFRGGKGINTLLGAMLAVNWQIALLCLAVFLIVLIASRYVSLSSMLAVLSFPIISLVLEYFFHRSFSDWFIVSGFGMFLLVVYTHRTNIKRLLHNQENRVNIKLKF